MVGMCWDILVLCSLREDFRCDGCEGGICELEGGRFKLKFERLFIGGF